MSIHSMSTRRTLSSLTRHVQADPGALFRCVHDMRDMGVFVAMMVFAVLAVLWAV